MKAAYISLDVHNVDTPLEAGSLPSGCEMQGITALLGLVPDLSLFHTPQAQGSGGHRGASPVLLLQDVNRASLSPGV